nr:winged helix-turn-helix transcriptional regulator [Prevotella denticola]
MSEQEKSVKENANKVTDTLSKVSKKVTGDQAKVSDRVTDKREMIVKKTVAKALENGDKLMQNRIAILQLMAENPYITKMELASAVGISATSIMRNIEYMRNKYLRRVGPDNGGFWEIIE